MKMKKSSGEIFIIDYKTGNKNDIQLENYKKIFKEFQGRN